MRSKPSTSIIFSNSKWTRMRIVSVSFISILDKRSFLSVLPIEWPFYFLSFFFASNTSSSSVRNTQFLIIKWTVNVSCGLKRQWAEPVVFFFFFFIHLSTRSGHALIHLVVVQKVYSYRFSMFSVSFLKLKMFLLLLSSSSSSSFLFNWINWIHLHRPEYE